MTNIDCTNPNTEIGKKYCNWIKDRSVQSCFTRDSKDNKVNFKDGKISSICLNRILEDSEYKKINLEGDYSSLGNTEINQNLQTQKQKLNKLVLNLSTIDKLNSDIENERETINADLEIKQRFTFSALTKLVVMALFIILFITTIMVNNDTLYDITFVLILFILFYNLYLFMKS